MTQQGAQVLQAALATAWADAADSKDQVPLRSQKIAGLLSLLQASHQQPWFECFLHQHVASAYPKPFRCLLDAVLQAYVAASPLNCGLVLQAFMQIPGCTNLNTPPRRDLAALFRAPGQLSSCWQQQGAVVCSVVAYLSTCACQELWALQQQQQQQQGQQHAVSSTQVVRGAAAGSQSAPARQEKGRVPEQRLGTAISWLADCLLAAVPHQQLALLQLALATAVAECTRLEQQQAAAAAGLQDAGHHACEPAAKRPRRAEQDPKQQHQRPEQEQGDTNTGTGLRAKQLGLQLLIGVCCCEILQLGSRSLLAPAAAAAAATVAGDSEHANCALQCSSWLWRQLCVQVTAPVSAPAAVAGATSAAAGGAGSAAGAQVAAAVGLQASGALTQLLQQVSNAGAELVLQLVHIVMGATAPAAAAAAAAGCARQAARQAAATPPVNGNAAAAKGLGDFNDELRHLLEKAASQWRALPNTACQGKQQHQGKRGGKGKQHQLQQHQQGMAAAAAAAEQVLPVPLQQVMPDAPNVSATWICRHVVPVLLQLAQEQWQAAAQHQLHQQQQQQQQVSRQTSTEAAAAAAKNLPAVAALARLLAADGLLLPAAGEVLVSARYLAETLNAVPAALQDAVAAAWRQQLHQQQAAAQTNVEPGPGSIAAVVLSAHQQQQESKAASDVLPWRVLQPMLCLLSYLEQASPLAQFLASCVRGCITTAVASTAGSSSSGSSGSSNRGVREVLQHILLPVRFGIKMPGRLWLLQQLLTPDSEEQQQRQEGRPRALAGAPDAAAQGCGGSAADVLECLEQLLQGEAQQQMAEGLQLLAQQQHNLQQQQQQQKDTGRRTGAGGGYSGGAGASLSLQQTHALDLAAGLLQLIGTLGNSCDDSTAVAAGTGAAVATWSGWQQQAAKRLRGQLQAAAAAASCDMRLRLW